MGPYWKKLSNIVRTKWLFENKTVEKRVIARNKTHFVAQVEGIDFEYTGWRHRFWRNFCIYC